MRSTANAKLCRGFSCCCCCCWLPSAISPPLCPLDATTPIEYLDATTPIEYLVALLIPNTAKTRHRGARFGLCDEGASDLGLKFKRSPSGLGQHPSYSGIHNY